MEEKKNSISELYLKTNESFDQLFYNELTAIGGEVEFCKDSADFVEKFKNQLQTKNLTKLFCKEPVLTEMLLQGSVLFCNAEEDFLAIDSAINICEFLIARTGSIMVSSAQASGRRLNVYAPVLFIVAYKHQLVYDISDAISEIVNKNKDVLPSVITTITGPSRTADIEKTLVMGAHGPKELVVFILEK